MMTIFNVPEALQVLAHRSRISQSKIANLLNRGLRTFASETGVLKNSCLRNQ
jgi:hypothetical protein